MIGVGISKPGSDFEIESWFSFKGDGGSHACFRPLKKILPVTVEKDTACLFWGLSRDGWTVLQRNRIVFE